MKKILLLFSIVVLSSPIMKAQHNTKSAIGFTFSPDYAYKSILNTDSINKLIGDISSNPSAIMGFTSGLYYKFKLFGLLNIETGLNYTRKGWSEDSVNTQSIIKDMFNYNYAVVPLKIRMNFPTGRKFFYINAGVSGGLLLNAVKTVSTSYFNGNFKTEKTAINKDLNNKIYYNVLFGAGLDYRIIKSLYFKIEPQVQMTLSEYSKQKLGNFLHSGGVTFGLLYGIK